MLLIMIFETFEIFFYKDDEESVWPARANSNLYKTNWCFNVFLLYVAHDDAKWFKTTFHINVRPAHVTQAGATCFQNALAIFLARASAACAYFY
jgi:hypothetical protein